jgi:hypothetical protein
MVQVGEGVGHVNPAQGYLAHMKLLSFGPCSRPMPGVVKGGALSHEQSNPIRRHLRGKGVIQSIENAMRVRVQASRDEISTAR